MPNDLHLYNVDTLQELYAVSFWKAYKVWPRANSAVNATKTELIQSISELSDKILGDYYDGV
jgi:hypothetical protein